jgi:DNA-binding MarR family transcriptional regulator
MARRGPSYRARPSPDRPLRQVAMGVSCTAEGGNDAGGMTDYRGKESGGARRQERRAGNPVWQVEPGLDPDMPPLGNSVGFLVRIIQLQTFQLFFRRFEGTGLSIGALTTLGAIYANPGIRHGVLADALMIKRPNFTKVINGLERKGLITREAPGSDRRTTALFITRKGIDRLESIRDKVLRYHTEMTAVLTPAELDGLLDLLHRVSTHLEELLDNDHAPVLDPTADSLPIE